MGKKILIVEDEFSVANHLRLILESSGYEITGIAVSVAKALELIEVIKPDMVILDIHLKEKLNGIFLSELLREQFIPFIYLSANYDQKILQEANATNPYGFVVKPFREKDLLVALEIAWYRCQQEAQAMSRAEQLLAMTLRNLRDENLSYQQKLKKIFAALQLEIPFDMIAIVVNHKDSNCSDSIFFSSVGFNEYEVISSDSLAAYSGLPLEEINAMQKGILSPTEPVYFNSLDFAEFQSKYQIVGLLADLFNLHSKLRLPMRLNRGDILSLSFYSKSPDKYEQKNIEFLSRTRHLLESAFTDIISKSSADRLSKIAHIDTAENLMQRDPLFSGIIGKSPQLLTVFCHVCKVAPVDTSVLVLGENGTGKERIAKTIHERSPRNIYPLIIVNCATLPPNLIESELFGHERGSFTGATEKRIGKFEQAHKGTIFLDEIGELPLSLQVKLLRVLQEREIERIGGKGSIKIDVRIIAATNRNLEKEVAEGRFRMDLFYRLNVFPICVPPLRERLDDIPILATYFIQQSASRMQKKSVGVSSYALEQLMKYEWPGNIRELENLIERTMVVNEGQIIEAFYFSNSFLNVSNMTTETGKIKTIEEIEKEHIINVLDRSKHRVFGPGGAAELLGIAPTTLSSKIKRFGIVIKNPAKLK